jgi:sec-independent protein translocase protein TatB
MLDMSWGEVMVIGGVALIVIGPKDLPKALRTVGQITGKLRRMAGEFHTQFNEAMREADLDDVRKDLESINRNVMASTSTGFNPIQTIRDELKGAVEGKAVTPAAAPVAWEPSPVATEVVPSSPELAIASTAAEGVSPPHYVAETSAIHEAIPVEEVGAPPALMPARPEPNPAHASTPPLDLTGPGLEQVAPPAPANTIHQGDRA